MKEINIMSQDILLKIKDITKVYKINSKTEINALNKVSLEIKKGEIFGLLGVNGAGKTTLSSIISTLHPATSGEILFGDNLDKSIYSDLINYRYTIGFCPQKPNIDLMLTMEENLLFAGRYFNMPEDKIRERIDYLMKKFSLTKYAESSAHALSGGYKQRFVIARTLMHSPKLVILDEPTVGLDPHIRRELWEFIKQLKSEGVTVLLTTHYLDEAEALSDRVCILDHGEIKLIDTPKNLKAKHNEDKLEDVFIKLVKDTN